MIKWGVRVALVVALCALAVWLWRVLVPTQEQIIHKRLVRIAQLASFSSGESPLVKLASAQELANLCTADAEIAVDIPGQTHRFSGRDDIREAALMARSAVSALRVEFLDINVTLSPDKQTAEAHLTAKGKMQGEPVVQELKIEFKKIDGKWLIHRVETVKTLS